MDGTSVVIVSTLLEEDRRKSCEEIAHEANMSAASVFRIVTQTLQKRRVAAKWVSHQLSEEQKAARKRVAEELMRCYEAEGEQFLNRIVAIDETWIRDFESQLKSQSSQWKQATSPRPKKCRRQQSKVKLVMIMAYDKNGVIATDRVPSGSTVTVAYYRKFLKDVLRPKIRQKSPPFSQPVSSFCTITRGLMPQVQYRKFWKSMDGKCFLTRRTVLTCAHQTLTCSQN
jgi:hypothetical protein